MTKPKPIHPKPKRERARTANNRTTTGFRDLKSDGWHWQRSQVWQPDHAQRLLFVLVLAYAWTLTHGAHLRQALPEVQRLIKRGKREVYSLFRQGLRYMARLRHDHQPLYLELYFCSDTGIGKSVVT